MRRRLKKAPGRRAASKARRTARTFRPTLEPLEARVVLSATVPGFNTSVLPRNDDGSTASVPLGFNVNYFGHSYSAVYVNNNGNVTFDSPQSTYTPFGLTATARKIIAPFFADVDTRFAGSTVTYGAGTVEGHAAFGVNWINVDYYPSSTAHSNRDAFQLLLIDRSDIGSGDFDIEFNYDQLQWETGGASGGNSSGLGGYSAHVGFSNGTGLPGTNFEMAGSGKPGTFLDSNPGSGLIYNSLNSDGVLGRYIFPVRNDFIVTVVAPPSLSPTAPDFITVQYQNVGLTPMPAPVLQLTASQHGNLGAFLTLDPTLMNVGHDADATPVGFSPSVQILASGETPGVLQPGESASVAVYYGGWQHSQWNAANPGVAFTVATLFADNPTAIDWDSMQSSMQPPSIASAAWPAIFANLTSQLGATWGSYVQALDGDAAHLGALGENVTNVNHLWALEMQEANGLGPVKTLASAVDLSLSVPGIPLSLGRSFSASVTSRNVLGPFGYGWATAGPWGQTLAVQGDGSVLITDANGSQLPFTASGAGFVAPPGDHDTLANLGGGVFTLTRLNGQVTQFVDGRVAYVQDADGNRITAGYTGALLTTLSADSGQWIALAYNGAGRVVTATDSTGRTTQYAYDATNQYLLSATQFLSAADATGSVTSYSYDLNVAEPARTNTLLSVTTPDGTQRSFTYDAQGRLSQSTLNGGAQPTTYAYDVGQATVTDADGVASSYSYDERGLLTALTTSLGTTQYQYDTAGNLLQQTGADQHSYSYSYNAQGQVLQSTDPLGNVTQYSYAALGALASVTDPNGNTTQYGHNANGDQTSTLYADGALETNAFNAIGELLQSSDANGNVVNYTYNAAGQILSKSFSDGTHSEFSYDQYGNLTAATNATGTTSLTYDARNRLTEIDYPGGLSLQYTYDAAGRRATMTDQSGYTVNYSYDNLGRISGLSDGSGALVSYAYDAAGRLSETQKGNGTYTDYTYSNAGNILSVVNYAPDGSINSSFLYTYNNIGLRTSMTTLNGQWSYTYDAIGQLTHAVFTPNYYNSAGLTSQDLQYFYDAAGNRTQSIANGVSTTYTVNLRNQYTATNTGGAETTYAYDANGNLTSQTDNDGTTSYTYDLGNRLVGIQQPEQDPSTYQYDPLGNLFSSTQLGLDSRYLVDPSALGSIVGQYDGANNLVAGYVNGLGLVSQIDALGNASFYDFDALGATADLTNALGSVIQTYAYLPFGEVVSSSGAAPNPFLFAGQAGVAQLEGGLDLTRARSYDPQLGRFNEQDPIGISGGTNLYAYVSNNPIMAVDPSGLTGEGLDPEDQQEYQQAVNRFQQINDLAKKGVGIVYGPSIPGPIGEVKKLYDIFDFLQDAKSVLDSLPTQSPAPTEIDTPTPELSLPETVTPPTNEPAQQEGIDQAEQSPDSTDPYSQSSYDTNNSDDTYPQDNVNWDDDSSSVTTNTDNPDGSTSTDTTSFDSYGNESGGDFGDPLYYYAGTSASGTPLTSPPTAPGTYLFVNTDALGHVLLQGTIHIPQSFSSTPLVPGLSVSDGGTFNGQPFAAQVALIGSDGQAHHSLEGVQTTVRYYDGDTVSGPGSTQAPVEVGTYTVTVSFPGSADYSSASAQATFEITQATPTLTLYANSGTYNAASFTSTATVTGIDDVPASSLEGVPVVLTYFAGPDASGTPLPGAPVDAGIYTVLASFAGSANYAAASDTTTLEISQATPTLTNLRVANTTYHIATIASLNNFANGGTPTAGLVIDGNGNLFGTAHDGGAFQRGTIFEVVAGSTIITTLASFDIANGAYPNAALTIDSSGNLFGTTTGGGANGYGTIFELPAGSGTIVTLASFNNNNGAFPNGLILDDEGNLYGTTSAGGTYGYGTLFELTAGSGTIATLASFDYSNGASPNALMLDDDGNLFGTTASGGPGSYGTLFELPAGSGTIATRASFNYSNGSLPRGLIRDDDGNFFGTTSSGGTNGYGTVFELPIGSGAISTLASFLSSNGASPSAGLIQDSHGNLFGTTPYGGADGYGTVFQLAVPTIYYGTPSTTVSGTLAGGYSIDPAGQNVSVTLNGTTLLATLDSANNFYVNFDTSALSVAGSPYDVTFSFAGDNNFLPAAASIAFNVVPNLAPVSSVDPMSYWSNGPSFVVNWSGTDYPGGSGIAGYNIFVSVDDGAYTEWQTNTTATSAVYTVPPGATSFSFYSQAIDNSGHGEAAHTDPDATTHLSQALYSFSGDPENGSGPESDVIVVGSTLYGTTSSGGPDQAGIVFSMNVDGSDFRILHQFTGADGGNPQGGLTLSGSTLYGTTSAGGSFGYGTLFSIQVDGSNYRILHNFAGSENDGSTPLGDLTLSGSTLYGTTEYGAAFGFGYNQGTVYSIDTDGSNYHILHVFSGGQNDGSLPYGGVTLVGATLYGTTKFGGSGPGYSEYGTLFSLDSDGSNFQLVHTFSLADGAYPVSALVASGSTLFGTTQFGGANYQGALFSVGADGSNFQVMHDFAGGHDGVSPSAGLTLVGSTLYGVTASGGDDLENPDSGTLFSIDTDGANFQILHTFGMTDGSSPQTSLAIVGSTIYTAPSYGGEFGFGAVVSMNLDGSSAQVLHSFGSGFVGVPRAGLILSGSTLYGTASSGGSYGFGTVYSVDPDGSNFHLVHEFSGIDGAAPYSSLTLVGSLLVGTTLSGGDNGDGEVFAVNTDGTNFHILHSFDLTDGQSPEGSLVLAGTTLFGTTSGGGSAYGGTVFSLETDGSNFQVLHNFLGGSDDGVSPFAGLTLSGTTLYGTTTYGGSNSAGTVFSLDTNGSNFQVLHNFQYSNVDGAYPYAGLVLSGTSLFGTTFYGGNSYDGTLFSLDTDGSNFQVLHSFAYSSIDGGFPHTGLFLSGATLYGTTYNGGSLNLGTVYSIATDGSNFQILRSFSGSDGTNPDSDLIRVGAALYGTTYGGGNFDLGTVFAVPGVIAPRVSAVQVDGSSWSSGFLTMLDSAGLGDGSGYAIPVGSAAQTKALPWVNLDQIQIAFDEEVSVQENSLSLTGVNVDQYLFSDFHYDHTSHIATWTLTHPIGADTLFLLLKSTGPDAVTNTSGVPLDAEWNDGASEYPAGDGTAGGDFNFTFNVLPGDVNQDGIVSLTDLTAVAAHWNTPGFAGDANGDGIVSLTDLTAIASNWHHQLPSGGGEGAGTPDESGGANPTPAIVQAPPVSPPPLADRAVASDAIAATNVSLPAYANSNAATSLAPATISPPAISTATTPLASSVVQPAMPLSVAADIPNATSAGSAASPAVNATAAGLSASQRPGPTTLSRSEVSESVANSSSLVVSQSAATGSGSAAPQALDRVAAFLGRASESLRASSIDSLMANYAAEEDTEFQHGAVAKTARPSRAAARRWSESRHAPVEEKHDEPLTILDDDLLDALAKGGDQA